MVSYIPRSTGSPYGRYVVIFPNKLLHFLNSQTISVLNFPTSKEKSSVLPAVTQGVEFVIIDLGTDLCINYTFYIECMRAMPV